MVVSINENDNEKRDTVRCRVHHTEKGARWGSLDSENNNLVLKKDEAAQL